MEECYQSGNSKDVAKKHPEVKGCTIANRFKRLQEGYSSFSSDRRGQHRRIFSDEEEHFLPQFSTAFSKENDGHSNTKSSVEKPKNSSILSTLVSVSTLFLFLTPSFWDSSRRSQFHHMKIIHSRVRQISPGGRHEELE